MEQKRKSSSKPLYIRLISLKQRSQESTTEKGQSLQEMVLRKLDSYLQKKEIKTTVLHQIQKLTQNGFKT